MPVRIVLELWAKLWERIWLWLTDYDLSDADIQRAIAKARKELEQEEKERGP
jgi:uncharacterized protein (DUF433 family)